MGNPDATEEQCTCSFLIKTVLCSYSKPTFCYHLALVMFAAEASGLLEFVNTHLDGDGEDSEAEEAEQEDEGKSAESTNVKLATSASADDLSLLAASTQRKEKEKSQSSKQTKSTKPKKKSKDKSKKKKDKKSKKKKKRRKAGDSDDSDNEGGMTRTLSFAELGEIVQPHDGFYDSTLSATKFPARLGSSNDLFDSDDSESDIGTEEETDFDASDVDKEEEELHEYQVEDDSEPEDPPDAIYKVTQHRSTSRTTDTSSQPIRVVGASESTIQAAAQRAADAGMRMPRSASVPNLSALSKRNIKYTKSILDRRVAAGAFSVAIHLSKS